MEEEDTHKKHISYSFLRNTFTSLPSVFLPSQLSYLKGGQREYSFVSQIETLFKISGKAS